MRKLTIGFLALTALGSMSTARAADFTDDYLRGPDYEPVTTQVIDWSGFYIGGHGGYSTTGHNFKNAFDPLTTQALGKITSPVSTSGLSFLESYDARSSGPVYGGFAGYNLQYDDLIVGIEADYSHVGQNAGINRTLFASSTDASGNLSFVRLNGNAYTKLIEYGTIRARFGYAFENIMPYVTAGVAVGSGRAFDLVTAQPGTYFATAPSVAVLGAPAGYYRSKFDLVSGLAVGAGIEYAITSNIILRGEYQYVSFDKINGHYFDINSFRGGAAYKF